mmetsp:Transcript_30033/g.63230  ORF Transcript_30033/g.63230 Transcript_30033/m.63230 type:complete len:492 (+) Transcript_30033:160-1635(+)|eukprot:CAMPEP_0171342378 /NCGR_PEP_ID=MMETSP0878-20121228/14207_1 /TAXON_ID=67004 /ORGANISM="Thalassiosira weissflogii, Strain CCMP1336" /LENGTH=491 /DNA_ID=CAMNT_0011845027 /DNA_START=89 /DNA_END=1564 /DNA_ORIENTATION=-
MSLISSVEVILCLAFLLLVVSTWAFSPISTSRVMNSWSTYRTWNTPVSSAPDSSRLQLSSPLRSSSTKLYGGVGVASTYRWKEEQFEIEVTIPVPPGTQAKNVKFKCSSTGIDLRLANMEIDGSNDAVLLDGSRQMRGKVCVDGTFWSLADASCKRRNKEENQDKEREREITITIEKLFVPTSSMGGVQTYDSLTDFDWGGLYNNDEEEVTFRKYEEAEELDVKEYAAKLGVDIDNLDMSKVDKTMFGAGLGNAGAGMGDGKSDDVEIASDNEYASGADSGKGFHFNITQATLDQLTKTGLAKEIVQQGDGVEYELDSLYNDDPIGQNRKKFSMLGDGVLETELRDAGLIGSPPSKSIPDDWQQSIPLEEAPSFYNSDCFGGNGRASEGILEDEIVEKEIVSNQRRNGSSGVVNLTSENTDASQSRESSDSSSKEREEQGQPMNEKVEDPIDILTVARLKEILRDQGLKVTGTKQVLRNRLRDHVNSLLQE